MCGRAVRHTPARDMAKLFQAQLKLEDHGPAYNIGPTQEIPAVRLGKDEDRELVGLHWGLLPPWARPDGDKRPPMLNNARAESVTEKRTFAQPFKKGQRCLIVFDGFYEWLREDKKNKRPFYFHRKDGVPIAMAGLWTYNKAFDKESGTVLTTSANALMKQVHDRMPCILLTEEEQAMWLDPETPEPALKDLLAPCRPDTLACYEVAKTVNNIRNRGEECMAPLDEAGGKA